jgi:hypothetical protein
MSAPANWRRRYLLRRTWARDRRIVTRLDPKKKIK